MISILRASLLHRRGALFLPVFAIVCGFEPNDSEPRHFGFSLGSSCVCINLPRKGELLLAIMFCRTRQRTVPLTTAIVHHLFRLCAFSCDIVAASLRKDISKQNIGHRRTVRRSVGDRKAEALQAACWIRCRVSSEQMAERAFCCRAFFLKEALFHGKNYPYPAHRR